MSDWHADRLSPKQREWVQGRLHGIRLVRDMSWNLIDSVVLHVESDEGAFIVKAGGPTNHHIDRELTAHPRWTAPLIASGHAARLADALREQRVMILDYLPGILAEGTDAEHDTDAYVQAGVLLRALHAQETRKDADYEPHATARALRWFEEPHRVDSAVVAAARRILEADPAPSVSVAPTHGDWQPRNWLIDQGVVRVIDFGRFGFRPASTDLTRLAARQWAGRPELEAAFFEGYGDDPRDPDRWRLDRLREAIGTACWAYRVGDEHFEAQGHRMLAEVLDEF